mgnify:CR=1 FL=1
MWERYVLHQHGIRVDGSFRQLTGPAQSLSLDCCAIAVTVWFIDSSISVVDERFGT